MVVGAWGRQSSQVCNQDTGRNECWLIESETPAHRIVLSTFRVDLLFSIMPSWKQKHPCRHNSKSVSTVIQNLVLLTMIKPKGWSRSGKGKVELWGFERQTEEEERGNEKQTERGCPRECRLVHLEGYCLRDGGRERVRLTIKSLSEWNWFSFWKIGDGRWEMPSNLGICFISFLLCIPWFCRISLVSRLCC